MIISLKAFKSFKRTISFANKMGYTTTIPFCRVVFEKDVAGPE